MRSAIKRCWPLGFLGALFLCASCGTGNETSSDPSSASGDATAATADAAASALTDLPMASLSSLAPSPGGAALSAEEGEEYEGEETELEEDYQCTYDETAHTSTCECPGGGTVTHTFQEAEVDVEISDEGSWSGSFQTTFSDCVVSGCGEETQVLNGEMEGEYTITHDGEGGDAFTVVQRTAEECAGMSVNETSLGFEITISFRNMQLNSFQGQICFDPPGEVITLESEEDLWEIMDPEGMCGGGHEEVESSEE